MAKVDIERIRRGLRSIGLTLREVTDPDERARRATKLPTPAPPGSIPPIHGFWDVEPDTSADYSADETEID